MRLKDAFDVALAYTAKAAIPDPVLYNLVDGRWPVRMVEAYLAVLGDETDPNAFDGIGFAILHRTVAQLSYTEHDYRLVRALMNDPRVDINLPNSKFGYKDGQIDIDFSKFGSPDDKPHTGNTALHLAAGVTGDERMVSLLLSHPKIRFDIKNDAEETPAEMAEHNGFPTLAAQLREAEARQRQAGPTPAP